MTQRPNADYEPPTKMPRLAGEETPPLLRDLAVLRDHFLPCLSTSDCVALRSTSQFLFHDSEIAARAFAGHAHVRCLFHGCAHDWCKPSPFVLVPSTFQCAFPPQRTADETVEALETALASPQRCVALLALARLMSKELKPLLYTEKILHCTIYYTFPFILPLSHLREIAQQGSGPATALGCHVANCTADGERVTCALCSALETANPDTFDERKDAEEQALEDHLVAQGHECESAEFEECMEDFRASKATMEAIVEEFGRWSGGSSRVLTWLCEHGLLPPLELVDEAHEDDVDEACAQLFSHDPDVSFCAHTLRPLLAFFQRHGFGPVHRAMVSEFRSDASSYDEDCGVEMVGAEAPHGFFAGLYFVTRYT